jgi:hypothetical protein
MMVPLSMVWRKVGSRSMSKGSWTSSSKASTTSVTSAARVGVPQIKTTRAAVATTPTNHPDSRPCCAHRVIGGLQLLRSNLSVARKITAVQSHGKIAAIWGKGKQARDE